MTQTPNSNPNYIGHENKFQQPEVLKLTVVFWTLKVVVKTYLKIMTCVASLLHKDGKFLFKYEVGSGVAKVRVASFSAQ